MKSDPEIARRYLQNAMQAMQAGDRLAARKWSEQAVALDPDSEEPWLFLAVLASPRASINYLERALKINPQSQRARQGMHWAADRLRREQELKSSLGKTQPHRKLGDLQPVLLPPLVSESRIHPQARTSSVGPGVKAIPQPAPPSKRAFSRNRWTFLSLFLVFICIAVAWLAWPGSASSALALLHPSSSTAAWPRILVDLIGSTSTPSQTATLTPTSTFTPTPTATATSTFTPSPTDTQTPTPTDTASPTATDTPTDTPSPTDTQVPQPTDTPAPPVNVSGGGTRWIDVNLSQQTLYAYEGDTVVASFLVSTGVWQFPTVTGQYHIYVKLLSTTMSGIGYYLPNVPYTMYFYKGYGIHGTYWHNNFGHPMSHGCVNMYTPDAEWMFNWASVGTLVNIHY